MSDQFIKTKVLITVMTYPHPSRGYQELVCTAGITENHEWVRLYPICKCPRVYPGLIARIVVDGTSAS
ncbi:MAG: hypothetical protein O2890_14060, partial [Cyanobacteria bacterium]|nr:hypothetical protein [Cyanobacteriota bacterium]MDA0867503.1 hypothetical protein [Cyanobacteriota bacterium]